MAMVLVSAASVPDTDRMYGGLRSRSTTEDSECEDGEEEHGRRNEEGVGRQVGGRKENQVKRER
jgi:hypothetical protein